LDKPKAQSDIPTTPMRSIANQETAALRASDGRNVGLRKQNPARLPVCENKSRIIHLPVILGVWQ
jgi:hypothetical protein